MSIEGEWWIDEGGQETYADGDIGDVNHEGVAFYSALQITDDTYDNVAEIKYKIDEILEDLETNHLDLLKEEFGDDYKDMDFKAEFEGRLDQIYPGQALDEIDKAVLIIGLDADEKAVEFFADGGADARDYMMLVKNWIRVAGNNFQMGKFDEDARKRICDFIENEYPEDEDYLEDEFGIEAVADPKGHWTFTGEELCNSGKTAEAMIFAARRERPGWYNPY